MNKRTLERLAREDAARRSRRIQEPQSATPEAVETANAATDRERLNLQSALYVALVGNADFERTATPVAEICRRAFARSVIAASVWREEVAR